MSWNIQGLAGKFISKEFIEFCSNFDLFCFGEKHNIWKGNLYLTENRLSWNEMCRAADNHNYMCHICAKEFLDSSFTNAVVDKISDFHEIAPNFTYSHKL